jgi:uncharacterized protein (TIGR04222 family)
MDFLLDNPLASMEGVTFIVLFIIFNVFTLAIVGILRSNIDDTDKLPAPAIPPRVDPYEVAFLRGGVNEMARSLIFSLVQKGHAEIVPGEKEGRIRRTVGPTDTKWLSDHERAALNWLEAEREAKEVFDDATGLTHALQQAVAQYEIDLANRRLLVPDEYRSQAKRYALAAVALIVAVGGYKTVVAIIAWRYNVIGAIVITIIGAIIAASMASLPRMTKLGKKYLERLQAAFEDLKYRSQAPYIGSAGSARPILAEGGYAGVDPLLLSVGVFGTGILTGTVFANYNDAFARAQQQQASSGGCGSSCGSGCGSGCGGGCGGCG